MYDVVHVNPDLYDVVKCDAGIGHTSLANAIDCDGHVSPCLLSNTGIKLLSSDRRGIDSDEN